MEGADGARETMEHNRANGKGVAGGRPTATGLSTIVWQTDAAIELPFGAVIASGEAQPQVRWPERLATLGDLAAQISHVQAVIVECLTTALRNMELTIGDLTAGRDEIVSLTLVAANGKLAAVGVTLLDLRIDELLVDAPR